MALKVLVLRHKLDALRGELEEREKKDSDFQTRSEELAATVEEVTTDDDMAVVEAEIEKFDAEKSAHDEAKAKLTEQISQLENELAEEEKRQEPPAKKETRKNETERNVIHPMEKRLFSQFSYEERTSFVNRDEVKEFLTRVRALAGQNRAVTGADLLIPTAVLDLIRLQAESESKLIPFVRYRRASGTARQNMIGAIPEAVWTEACAKLNELDLVFNQVEVDGYKVGGYIAVCNATLEDSDENLAGELVYSLGAAIGKAVDMAILFGTGVKMPVGITTRLYQESAPENWGANAPTWSDLHTSNVLSLDINDTTGTAFFSALMAALGVAKPVYSSDGLFWVMNRKTHVKLLGKAMAFDNGGALVAGLSNRMPILGGEIVEMENDNIPDDCIIGGFGGNYLMVERNAATFARSEERLFIEDQTVFKATARFDGKPVAGEAFVVVNFANGSADVDHDFPEDMANAAAAGK